MTDIQNMIGKEVEVMANGMKYIGVLIEVSDAEVHLKGPFQWITLSTSSISGIRLQGEIAGRKLEPWDETGAAQE